ncbi:GTP-binding protein A [Orchesella cincta]|uniref:GTP-binding protein A n=1 Tax=Orchesella cincta TaxID=48709 RepID=A0A1D2MV42_ORCCI|nr:GTP-binding protein A [Orchesella cincta]
MARDRERKQKRKRPTSQVIGTEEPSSERRTWRKRFGGIFSVFGRYILRRRATQRVVASTDEPTPAQVEQSQREEERRRLAIETAKRRKLPCYFLFLGLSQSGKSTTISKLFNGERPKNSVKEDPAFKIYTNEAVGQNLGIRIVDTPGLLGSNSPTEDSEIIIGLKNFLRQELPARIPTVTFITARLDDDDIDNNAEGKESNFTRMLSSLAPIRKYITDKSSSNIVLLLTHSDKAARSGQGDIKQKISQYQTALSETFRAKNPIPIIAIDNIIEKISGGDSSPNERARVKRYHDLVFQALQNIAKKREEQSLSELVGWLTGKSKRFSISFKQELIPISILVSQAGCYNVYGRSDKYLAKIEPTSPLLESTDENESPPPFDPFLIVQHTPNQQKKKRRTKKGVSDNKNQQQNFISYFPAGTEIILSNGETIKVEDCLVGDKLLNYFLARPSVIISISGATIPDILSKSSHPVGRIYCAGKQEENMENSGLSTPTRNKATCIYQFNDGDFRLVEASEANLTEKISNDVLYFSMELDSSDGTIVADGYPCLAATKRLK